MDSFNVTNHATEQILKHLDSRISLLQSRKQMPRYMSESLRAVTDKIIDCQYITPDSIVSPTDYM